MAACPIPGPHFPRVRDVLWPPAELPEKRRGASTVARTSRNAAARSRRRSRLGVGLRLGRARLPGRAAIAPSRDAHGFHDMIRRNCSPERHALRGATAAPIGSWSDRIAGRTPIGAAPKDRNRLEQPSWTAAVSALAALMVRRVSAMTRLMAWPGVSDSRLPAYRFPLMTPAWSASRK